MRRRLPSSIPSAARVARSDPCDGIGWDGHDRTRSPGLSAAAQPVVPMSGRHVLRYSRADYAAANEAAMSRSGLPFRQPGSQLLT